MPSGVEVRVLSRAPNKPRRSPKICGVSHSPNFPLLSSPEFPQVPLSPAPSPYPPLLPVRDPFRPCDQFFLRFPRVPLEFLRVPPTPQPPKPPILQQRPPQSIRQ